MASKRYTRAAALVEREKIYPLQEAVAVLQRFPPVKFDESVELSIALGVDREKTDQAVRGTVVLPHGTGTVRRVAVFCKGEKESDAKQAGADYVGAADLIKKIQDGWMEFDVAIATPEMMKDVSKLGKVLGPRGLMPSPRAGTVTEDIAKAVTDVKKGKVEFKMDKLANLHVRIGKRSFQPDQLAENAAAVLQAVQRAKPPAVKGRYINRASVASTMSPGVTINVEAILGAEGAQA